MGEPAQATPAWEYASEAQVGFVGADGAARLGPLARYWGEPFELASPTRKFIAFKGQKNFTGDYWAATTRDLVGYESWVERDVAMALDFDPAVIALASQPFRLLWTDGDRDREHTPDYFARLSDGTGVVVDVRPESLVDEEAAEVFAFTARVCATVGWQFRLVGISRSGRICAGWRATAIRAATGRRWRTRCGRCSPNRRCCSRGPIGSETGWGCSRCSITCSGGTN
ncbi:TnsA-like heteromeric transposase endonuclease subunit [Streptomyces sp. RTd22]|uniref:TnsA-like heteromeric transposase endonuclease subunit n=1 Tax=Streptomyces sp. RTd22 TaxID=1841249 RepID=UPI000A7E25D9|nr:TnsA-like heteromeric transposase endonuclease subunit [Streptomyces sp. RTd22]